MLFNNVHINDKYPIGTALLHKREKYKVTITGVYLDAWIGDFVYVVENYYIRDRYLIQGIEANFTMYYVPYIKIWDDLNA